ncbi:DEAD/DEAH box helicase [Corynebacterium frankenforstense]
MAHAVEPSAPSSDGGASGPLSPLHASGRLEAGLTEYLATSFSLADPAAGRALSQFLQDPETGMFYGPYLRTRLPYRQIDGGEKLLDWSPQKFNFRPYAHQAAAFRRLRSINPDGTVRRPKPTMVVTGTGSGKTEAFLYPVLDHAVRERRRGKPGVKALLLYPMNALANDQAARLRHLLEDEPGLQGVSVGVYTGESTDGGGAEASIAPASPARPGGRKGDLTCDRARIRRNPPDVLLTNYKMLDQLLLRQQDRELWERSAESLTYLVLDEFHTYDGAQGTDVALLLRRLGLLLKSLQPEGFLDAAAAARPLGIITPVATSATLGNDADPSAMLHFARTIFGEEFTPEAVVTESALSVDEWAADMAARYPAHPPAVDDAEAPGTQPATAAAQAELIADFLADLDARLRPEGEDAGADFVTAVRESVCAAFLGSTTDLDEVLARYPRLGFTRRLLTAAVEARPLAGGAQSLTEQFLPHAVISRLERDRPGAAVLFTACMVAFIADTRARLTARASWDGKRVPGVEAHLWAREVSRIDRATGTGEDGSQFRWADDGLATDATFDAGTYWLPAIYCRHCGRSGWMVAEEPNEEALDLDGPHIRTTSVREPERQRPLLEPTGEEIAHSRRVRWLDLEAGAFTTSAPDDEKVDAGRAIPVLGYEAAADQQVLETTARDQVCPSCGERDAIRYIGSSVATLLSVALSNFFGMPELDSKEKKTLVFADSVQDAAHRAAFVQSRSRAFELRALINAAVSDDAPATLTEIAEGIMVRAGDDRRRRFELLPARVATLANFRAFWDPATHDTNGKPVTASARREATKRARKRIAFDIALEFGQRTDLPRSLANTGTLTCQVAAADADLEAAAQAALVGAQITTDTPPVRAWARGIVELVRIRGGVLHPSLASYLHDDLNSWQLHRPDARAAGVPVFPLGGAPEFPRLGPTLSESKSRDYTPLGSPAGRYARWTAAMLGLTNHDAADTVTRLIQELVARGVLAEPTKAGLPAASGQGARTKTGARVFGIDPERIHISRENDPEALRCSQCAAVFAFGPAARAALDGARCLNAECTGTLHPEAIEDNYYRSMYRSPEPRAVIAREHTGLLDTRTRHRIEEAFRGGDEEAAEAYPDAPNVLVATPTLEMGIDIGDLSTVMLSSMPPTVASYVQRVGRAGRLTGNSLVLATVRGRGQALPKLLDPLSVIAGAVRPPAAFLRATEILRRQFIARLIDSADPDSLPPAQTARDVLRGVGDSDSLVHLLAERVRGGIDAELDGFTAALGGEIDTADADRLRAWATGEGADSLVADLERAALHWQGEQRDLAKRLNVMEQRVATLQTQMGSNIQDDGTKEELDVAQRTYRYLRRRLEEVNSQWWVSALEYEGVLPNFTLLDDSVELTVGVTSLELDQTDQIEYRFDERSYTRGISSALHELAPGATFYAEGIAAQIDTVVFGPEGPEIEQWRVCPDCSHVEVVPVDAAAGGTAPAAGACPRCGNDRFGDKGQAIPVVTMSAVSARVDQTRDSISSSMEDRRHKFFPTQLAFDVPEDGTGPAWFTQGTGFGVRRLEQVDMRWMNLGTERGENYHLCGQEHNAGLFTVCRHCGHLPAREGRPSRTGHQPWCPHRDDGTIAQAVTQKNTLFEGDVAENESKDQATFALGRILRTQGLLVHIPRLVCAADSFAEPSLAAALQLGLRECLGGDPEHIGVAGVRVPEAVAGGTPGGAKVTECLMLYDQVPGGTGYLSQFAEPEGMRRVLLAAYRRVRECACGSDERLSCPECLLPYAGRQIDRVSRASAEIALRKLLLDQAHPEVGDEVAELSGADDDGCGAKGGDGDGAVGDWQISETPPEVEPGSQLELAFRELLTSELEARGFEVDPRSQAGRTTLHLRAPGQRIWWTMEPEKDFKSTRVDFYFSNEVSGVRDVAVYLDGARYHAAGGPVKVADDIAKRTSLYQRDHLPWSLTWADLERFQEKKSADDRWYVPDASSFPYIQDKVNATQMSYLADDPLRQLIDYLMDPAPEIWDALSEQAAVSFYQRAGQRGKVLRSARAGSSVAGELADTVAFEWTPQTNLYLALNPDTTVDQDEWNLFLNAANLVWARSAGAEVVCNKPVGGLDTLSPTEAALADSVGGAPESAGAPGTAGAAGATGAGGAAGATVRAGLAGAEVPGAAGDETAGEPGADGLSGRWAEVIAEFNENDEADVIFALQELATRGIAASTGNPGDQIGDVTAEVSWPDLHIALIYEIEAGVEPPAGWTVFTLDDVHTGDIPEQLIRTADGK